MIGKVKGGMSLASEGLLNNIEPQSIEAEEAILASMFLDTQAVIAVQEFLQPEDFFDKANGLLYGAMLDLGETGSAIDLVTLMEKLRQDDLLEKVGGVLKVTNISGLSPNSSHIRDYAKIVREKAMLRRIIALNNRVTMRCFDNESIEVVLEEAEKGLMRISKAQDATGIQPIADTIGDVLEHLELIATNPDKCTGVPSGFVDLDAITNGWQNSDFIIVAARPAMGKTAFCLNMGANAAIRYHKKILIFSLEMSREQLIQRLISSETGIRQDVLRTGKLVQEDWKALITKIEHLSNAGIYIEDTPGISVRELRAKAHRMAQEEGLDMIIIDYLQLMSGGATSENRQQEVSYISRSLKALARELNVPVIALSQLSRTVEQQKDKRPALSHLRESGSLEQDADMVLFIYRDEYYDGASEEMGIAEIIIAKHRNGATGTVKLAFRKEITKFDNLSFME